MFSEAEAIPYEAALLRGERLLVLAPHPDDEVIGCGGLVAQHLREKRAVRVVVVTDGAAAGDAATREAESRRGLDRLGEGAELVFLRLPDRGTGESVIPGIRQQLLDFRPDLVLVPGPAEIHPDHLALSRAFSELVQRDETLFADLAVARVAFYEVSRPLRPNTLVDISDVAETKYAAIAEHASQLAQRDYVGYARGLNAYRAMTLPPGTKAAEGYWVADLPSLRTLAFSELAARSSAPGPIEVTRETVPISVIVRTKDRPALLREAIASIRNGDYPCEIVVVEDGGVTNELPADVVRVRHDEPRGRSEAANGGVAAATGTFVAFLDDDDLYHREHLATLANAAGSQHAGWYSDAVSVFLQPGENGAYEEQSRLRLFAQDFDGDLLLLDNYIPLPTLLTRRETFLALGGFDRDFDLFEDWDFLIRLSATAPLLRIPRVTCEIRHFAGGDSIVLASPEGTQAFRDAKLRVWEKHASRLTREVIANAFERQKARLGRTFSAMVEAKGQAESARTGAARAWREKGGLQDEINGLMLRARELEGYISAKNDECHNKALHIEQLTIQRDAMERTIRELQAANESLGAELGRTQVEIGRLNALLDMIYGSKTWKAHTLLERLRGRG